MELYVGFCGVALNSDTHLELDVRNSFIPDHALGMSDRSSGSEKLILPLGRQIPNGQIPPRPLQPSLLNDDTRAGTMQALIGLLGVLPLYWSRLSICPRKA